MRKFKSVCGIWALIALLGLSARPSSAETFRLAMPEGAKNHFSFQVGLLKLALEYAPGDHTVEVLYFDVLSQTRVFQMLTDGTINIALAGYSPDIEQSFLQVDFPLTDGLQGYRLLAIRPESQSRFDQVASINDLADVCIGSGSSWQDTAIIRKAGLCVVEGPQNSLYSMLDSRRFDALHFAVHEMLASSIQGNLMEHGLVVEENLIFKYPYDFFYYLPKADVARHQMVEEAFDTAYRDGAFERYFDAHPLIKAASALIGSGTRRVIEIDDPAMSKRTKDRFSDYWIAN